MAQSDQSLPEEIKTSKLLQQCVQMFETMNTTAVHEEGNWVWRGRLMEVADALAFPRGTYSRVINALKKMGCIEEISRGFRGSRLTVYVLVKPPTYDEFCKISEAPLTGTPPLDRVVAELNDVKEQIGGLHIPSALAELQERLHKLETALQNLEVLPQTQTSTNKGEQ